MAVRVTEVDQKIAQWVVKSDTTLDLGCGDGRLTSYLAQQTGRRIIGVDLSQSGFRKARRLAYQAGVKHLVTCQKGDALSLNFPNDQFDVVILSYALHHFEDPPAVLMEIRRVLRPGGNIVISEHEAKEGKGNDSCYKYTLSELIETLVEAGFGNICWERMDDDVLLVAGSKTPEESWTKEKSLKY